MEILNEEQKNEAKALLEKLNLLYKERVRLDLIKVDRENALREEIASCCDVRNKDGESEPSKVKMPLVLALVDELFLEKQNKKEEEYAIMEQYRSAFANQVNKEIVDGYTSIIGLQQENTLDIKEVFKETSILSKEVIEAINYLAKDTYKQELQEQKIQAGIINEKEPKDDSEKLAMVDFLKTLLQGKNDA